MKTAENQESLGAIRKAEAGLLRSVVEICHKFQSVTTSLRKTAPIFTDDVVEYSLAFSTKDAVNFNERHYPALMELADGR